MAPRESGRHTGMDEVRLSTVPSTSTPDLMSAGSETLGARGTVLLLVSPDEDARALGEQLGESHEVLFGEQNLDERFDICVVDGGTLRAVWDRLSARRDHEAVLLPVVMLSSAETAVLATDLPAHVVDEVVMTPVDPNRLIQRIGILLEARRRDKALLRSRDEAFGALQRERDELEARVLERTHQAERSTEDAQRELETSALLLEAADALSQSVDAVEVLQALVDVARKATGRKRVTVALYKPESDEVEVATTGFGEKFPRGTRFAVDSLAPQTRTAIDQQRYQIVDYDEAKMPARNRRRAESIGYRLVLVVPLVRAGNVVGFFNVDEPGDRQPFGQREIDLATGIASQAAVAIENARLFEAERDRSRLARSLAEINADLASSLDIDDTMVGVFEKARAELGAFAAGVVDRIEGGWRIRVLVGIEPKVFKPGYVFRDELAPTLMRMLRSREPEIVSDIHESGIANMIVARIAGYEAYAGYPLLVRGEVVGALGVFFHEPRTLSDVEIDYCRRFGFSVSLAEENSRLYKAEHRIAETLQAALLALPERMEGISFAHFYASATEAARVGGDFYDLFELEHDMIGMTVGDIAGHGLDAAVLTSLVKNAIRVQSTEQRGMPHQVMSTTSKTLLANSPASMFATVFFGVLHLDDGLLEYCNAGHTTGACLCSSGGVTGLAPNSPLIGALPNQEYTLSETRLQPGDTVFLYTDGVTEARRRGELFGEERLFDLLAAHRGDDPNTIVEGVMSSVLEFANGELSDDVAILAVQRT